MSKPLFHEVRGIVFCQTCGGRAAELEMLITKTWWCPKCEADPVEDESTEDTEPGRGWRHFIPVGSQQHRKQASAQELWRRFFPQP